MSKKAIKSIIEPIVESILSIEEESTKSSMMTLVNLVEVLYEENQRLKKEVQSLKDEINKLKGEQGKPKFKKSKKKDEDGGGGEDSHNDHSSEKERNSRKPKKPRKPKKKKKANLPIDRKEFCRMDPALLPTDAEFKGYQTRIIQNIKIVTDNVEFKCEIYYSPSLKKSFIAKIPDGYHGDFGPGIRALTLMLYNDGDMTQPGIKRFYEAFDIEISKASISRLLIDNHDVFHQEKEAIIEAGLASTRYQGLDDTSARVNGQNYYTHILCNEFYTAYFTLPNKDRLTILTILCRGTLKYQFNDATYALLDEFGVSEKSLQRLRLENLNPDNILSQDEADALLARVFPGGPKRYVTYKKQVLEASAIIYYRNLPNAIKILMSDDAPQFHLLAVHNALCWIHALRHYKKLHPLLKHYQEKINNFLDQAWDFYHALLDYKDAPNTQAAEKLEQQFDQLFTIKTGYDSLDERIALTYSKKDNLLLVLTYPFIPLHNNASELGARKQARHRDIHLQTKNQKGTRAKDTFATITQTAKKLSVNIYHYLYDRITKRFQLPALANLIAAQAKTFDSS